MSFRGCGQCLGLISSKQEGFHAGVEDSRFYLLLVFKELFHNVAYDDPLRGTIHPSLHCRMLLEILVHELVGTCV